MKRMLNNVQRVVQSFNNVVALYFNLISTGLCGQSELEKLSKF